MRTTITIEPDVEALLRQRMRERGTSFKETVNQSLRAGLNEGKKREAFKTTGRRMGLRPEFDLTKANQLAARLEDEQILSRMHEARDQTR